MTKQNDIKRATGLVPLEKSFNGNPVRAVFVDGAVYQACADTARAIGLKDPSKSIRKLISKYGPRMKAIHGHKGGDSESPPFPGIVILHVSTAGGTQPVQFMDESWISLLIGQTQNELAVDYNLWIHTELIPAVRKHGRYDPQIARAEKMYARWLENQSQVPEGYFSVIGEAVKFLEDVFNRRGLSLPTRADDGSRLSPEVSIGLMWAKRFPEIADDPKDFRKYHHRESRWDTEVWARCYPDKHLGDFYVFLRTVWLTEQAPRYFAERSGVALISG